MAKPWPPAPNLVRPSRQLEGEAQNGLVGSNVTAENAMPHCASQGG